MKRVGGTRVRLLLCLALCAVVLLSLSGANALASPPYPSEAAFQGGTDAATWIVPEWQGHGIGWLASRDDLRAAIASHPELAQYGFTQTFADECSEAQITVVAGDTRSWAAIHLAYPNGLYWKSLWYGPGGDGLFDAGVTLHVFAWGDAFVSRVCGNFYGEVPGLLVVRKFDDSNVNGVWDGGEPEVTGWPVWYTGLGAWASTPVSAGVDAGEYEVTEGLLDGWAHTTATSATVQVAQGGEATVIFGNVRLGKIIKDVLHYWWQEPIEGVHVRLEEGPDEDRVIDQDPPLPRDEWTDCDGRVEFPDLLPSVYDDYELIVFVPDGWLPEPDPGNLDNTIRHAICLEEGDTWTGCNFIYDNPCREPRTLGFWINWRLRYSDGEMAALIERVKAGSLDFADLSLTTIDASLDPSGRKTRQEMATIQYLALWLNLASDRLGFLPEVNVALIGGWDSIIVDDDGIMSIHDLMLQLRALFNGGALTEQEWEVFKDICDAINNDAVFLEPPTGPID
jgi:hypothetical protein